MSQWKQSARKLAFIWLKRCQINRGIKTYEREGEKPPFYTLWGHSRRCGLEKSPSRPAPLIYDGIRGVSPPLFQSDETSSQTSFINFDFNLIIDFGLVAFHLEGVLFEIDV